MSIDEHPGPWTIARETEVVGGDWVDPGDVVDSNGHVVVFGNGNDLFTTELAERLILAAPELLAVLKSLVANPAGGLTWARAVQDGAALIDRIEKGEP